MRRHAVAIAVVGALASGAALRAGGQSGTEAPASHAGHLQQPANGPMSAPPGHDHGAPVPAVTFTELQRTAGQLATARQATEKYQDVRAAEAAGYHPIGPNVPGMGIHYVRRGDRQAFSITDPPILLYERDPTVPNGLRLVGVSYLFVAQNDADGQPVNSPFPKALASWHKHNNVCVLPDNSASVDLTESQCSAQGGRFTPETSWMLHAWIWKDSPTGVFSPTNPLVK
jgi:hypothetical protein